MASKVFLLLFLLVVFTAANVPGQTDKDVKLKEVPLPVKEYFLKKYPDAESVKYYKEIEGDTTFYEICFESANDKYSLLLFPDGRIYETEITISFEQLPDPVKENISKDLSSRYTKHKILLVEKLNPETTLMYEIKIHARKGRHKGYYEVFYDSNGSFQEEEEETLRSIPSNSGF
jgi:hypothetical protein